MREDGWYWVRRMDEYGGKWIVAYWGTNPMAPAIYEAREWWEVGHELSGDDRGYAEIGERITRDGK